MNSINDITDKEFIPFLHSLGVETYNKSFEWMLQDPDFGGALKWLYRNLDHNNALTAREEYRYKELEKKKFLLPLDELETAIASLQEEFEGLCLPGDQDSLEDMKLDISMHNDRLDMLVKHEEIVHDLIKQNQLIKDELDIKLTKLSATQQQYAEDERTLGEQCIALAEEVDTTVDNVCDVIANNLKMASTTDEETSSKFFAFGPFDAYKQSQLLYMSHFDLYVSKRLTNNNPDRASDQDLQRILREATNMEERLSDALCAYISTTANLCGVQAKLALVTNYTVHSSRGSGCLLEARNALEISEQEETILDQQLKEAILKFVSSRTNLAVETAARSALAIRKQVHSDLEFLLDTTQQALALDKLLYCALRNELYSIEELLHFASHLRQYLVNENEAVNSRIESMNEICGEQALREQRLQSSNVLQQVLCSMLGAEGSDAAQLVRLHAELRNRIQELNDDAAEGFKKKEMAVLAYSESSSPLRSYLCDGSTKQPSCRDPRAAQLLHQLRELMVAVDDKVVAASGRFAAVKKEDKHNLRKFWQWFLVDQAKLLSVIRAVQPRGHVP